MSELEEEMEFQFVATGLRKTHPYERQHRFDTSRRWAFDFAWPADGVALEVEGGTHNGGRHTRAGGFEADCEKYNEAALQRWTVLRVTGAMVRDGRALWFVERALGIERDE